jgi:hypothetical protein
MINKNLYTLRPFKEYKVPEIPSYYSNTAMENNLAVIPLIITKPYQLKLDNPYIMKVLFHWNILPKPSSLSLKTGLVVNPKRTFRMLEKINKNTLYFIWEESFLFNAFLRGER